LDEFKTRNSVPAMDNENSAGFCHQGLAMDKERLENGSFHLMTHSNKPTNGKF